MPDVKVFATQKEQRELFWKHSGFPPLQAPLPVGARVDVKVQRMHPDHTTIESGVVSGVFEDGNYLVRLANSTGDSIVFGHDIRPALSEDDWTFIEERVAQWAYSPDRFAKHVDNLEKSMR